MQFPQSSWDWPSRSSVSTPASSSQCEATLTPNWNGSSRRRRSLRTTTSGPRWNSTRTTWRAAWSFRIQHTSTTAITLWRPATPWGRSQSPFMVISSQNRGMRTVSQYYIIMDLTSNFFYMNPLVKAWLYIVSLTSWPVLCLGSILSQNKRSVLGKFWLNPGSTGCRLWSRSPLAGAQPEFIHSSSTVQSGRLPAVECEITGRQSKPSKVFFFFLISPVCQYWKVNTLCPSIDIMWLRQSFLRQTQTNRKVCFKLPLFKQTDRCGKRRGFLCLTDLLQWQLVVLHRDAFYRRW